MWPPTRTHVLGIIRVSNKGILYYSLALVRFSSVTNGAQCDIQKWWMSRWATQKNHPLKPLTCGFKRASAVHHFNLTPLWKYRLHSPPSPALSPCTPQSWLGKVILWKDHLTWFCAQLPWLDTLPGRSSQVSVKWSAVNSQCCASQSPWLVSSVLHPSLLICRQAVEGTFHLDHMNSGSVKATPPLQPATTSKAASTLNSQSG